MTSVLVVDDDDLMRAGLIELLTVDPDITVVGEAATGRQAVERTSVLAPDVVLMDVRMPDLDGIEATRTLAADAPSVKVLILTTFEQDDYVFGALRAGASGFLLKRTRPEELIAGLKAHPSIAPLVEGGDLKEYSAHLIPEGGWDMMPELGCPGMLVTGDAAALCLAAGIWLEGVNFAMGSGMVAGQVIDQAIARGTVAGADLAARYRGALSRTFVLQDHRKLRGAPRLVLSDRVQLHYPRLAADVAERMFRVDNPDPKPGLRRILREEQRRAGVRVRDLARDAYRAWRAFG